MEVREPLRDKEQTGKRMRFLASRFAKDLDRIHVKRSGKLIPLSALSLRSMHSFVRRIPYRRDVEPIEVIARPSRLLGGEFSALDCKKKAICLAAWAVCNRVPYRFVVSSRRPDRKFHHVFPQVNLRGEWINADATYSYMSLGAEKTGTAFEVLQ